MGRPAEPQPGKFNFGQTPVPVSATVSIHIEVCDPEGPQLIGGARLRPNHGRTAPALEWDITVPATRAARQRK